MCYPKSNDGAVPTQYSACPWNKLFRISPQMPSSHTWTTATASDWLHPQVHSPIRVLPTYFPLQTEWSFWKANLIIRPTFKSFSFSPGFPGSTANYFAWIPLCRFRLSRFSSISPQHSKAIARSSHALSHSHSSLLKAPIIFSRLTLEQCKFKTLSWQKRKKKTGNSSPDKDMEKETHLYIAKLGQHQNC